MSSPSLNNLFFGPAPGSTARLAGAAPAPNLGNLAGLVGSWKGPGFSFIALPDFKKAPFRLQANATIEQFTFSPIQGAVPDRGSLQPDIFYDGLVYAQQVSDATTGEGLHVETGMFLNVPATTAPSDPANIVRHAVVPHGNSVLAQGGSFVVTTPSIAAVSPLPFPIDAGHTLPLGYTDPYFTTTYPAGFDVENPNAALQTAIQGQNITSTTVIELSTTAQGGILNIPFVTTNANAVSLNATFWIETVQPTTGSSFLQLQYTQTILLNFEGISWPHITLATLVQQ